MSIQQDSNYTSSVLIKPPFPPTIEPKDLIKKSRDGIYTRTPNAFIIYRKLFIETAKSEGYFLPMTVISSMSSQSWEQESEMVKNEYKRIAKETYNYRKSLIPKTKQRRKREKWNIISFENDSTLKKNSPDEFLQVPTPLSPPSSESSQFSQDETTPFDSFDFDFTQDFISSPETSFFNNTDVDNSMEFQNLYTIPETSNNNFGSLKFNDQQFEFNLSASPADKYQIQDEIQNYQNYQQHININVDDFEIPRLFTTNFNTDYHISDNSNEFLDEMGFFIC